MATVNKDFKIKSGLIVEGTTATVNGYDILTKKQGDQDYIVGLIGGTSTPDATPNTVVKRDENADFSAGTITADLVGNVTGNADTATKLETARTISLTGDATGSISFDGQADKSITVTIDSSFATDSEVSSAVAGGVAEAASYTDGEISTALSTAQGYANTAEQNAKDYADGLASGYETAGAAAQALTDAKAYTDQEVSALVDSAPELLNTLNELAAAIADNPNYATDVANLVATKADTSYVNSEISDLDTAAQGYANTAQQNAENYAAGLASNYDAAGSAATALQDAKDYADALDTDDVAEGTSNLYFTDDRAKASAKDLLINATQNNIAIIQNNTTGGLIITAENGVADSTTDDLTEGENNLYFQNWRALDAVNGETITPLAVQINNYRKEEATQQYISNASTVNVHTFSYPYESAKYLIRVVGNVSGTKHSQLSEILVTVDGNMNIAVTEYGITHTSENPLATFSAVNTAGSDVVLTATTAVSGCEIIAAATMLSWSD